MLMMLAPSFAESCNDWVDLEPCGGTGSKDRCRESESKRFSS